ncbi:hypothetical protein LOAG_02641 [Loa loa]|uniref:Uncharacterized protein n=1 Tax=Loa loa TaxID=7209 RepID=A0A1S0U6Q4_LOALO|nr:hypothetical protein LOAG_02641 [Loa loa]EFO25841.1 hypothetical protein LOAG_02641 [Loa loa]
MKLKSKEEIKEIDLNINWFKFIYGQSEAASKGCAPEYHSDLNIGRFLERKGKAAGRREGWSRLLPRLRRQKKLAEDLQMPSRVLILIRSVNDSWVEYNQRRPFLICYAFG